MAARHPEIVPRHERLPVSQANEERDNLALPTASEGWWVTRDAINLVACFFLDEIGVLFSERLRVHLRLQI